MHAARHGAFRAVDGEEFLHLAQHAVERPGLVAAVGLDGVAVHRIAGPDHIGPFAAHRFNEPRQMVAHRSGPEARDQRQPPGLVFRVQLLHQHLEVLRRRGRPAFQAHRVLHAAREFHMRAVGLAGAVADPDHVARARDRKAGGGIDPAERFLVFQEQRFMAGVEIDRGDGVRGIGIHARGGHEVQRVRDPVGHVAVAVGLVILGKAEGPGMYPVDIGEAALAEGADQVQRRRRLGIGLQHLLGARDARLGGEIQLVDDVAPVGGQFHAVLHFGRRRARLGKLSGHAPHLDHRHLGGEGQHDRHLQHHLVGVADAVGGKGGKALGAITTLKQERIAARHGRQFAFQAARLAGEDQRRIAGKLGLDAGQGLAVQIVGHLNPRLLPPA